MKKAGTMAEKIEFLSARDQDLLTAKFTLPLLIIFLGGVYNCFTLGANLEHWPETYLVLGGSLVSFLIVFQYMKLVVRPKVVSLSSSLKGFSGLIAYGFSVYVIFYLGVYSFIKYSGVVSWAYGILMIVMGYRFLSVFYKITELGRRIDEIQKDQPRNP